MHMQVCSAKAVNGIQSDGPGWKNIQVFPWMDFQSYVSRSLFCQLMSNDRLNSDQMAGGTSARRGTDKSAPTWLSYRIRHQT